MTVKEEALEAISTLPDTADIESIMYRLYVLEKIKDGQRAIKEGRYVTQKELEEEIISW